MAPRKLGASGLTTPPLILGGNVFGWTADRATSFSILDAFIAAGGRMVDTADVYSAWAPGNHGGESESVIGAWLAARGRRDDVRREAKAADHQSFAHYHLATHSAAEVFNGDVVPIPMIH